MISQYLREGGVRHLVAISQRDDVFGIGVDACVRVQVHHAGGDDCAIQLNDGRAGRRCQLVADLRGG